MGRNFVLLAASSRGIETISPFWIAIILPYCLFLISSAAAVPTEPVSTPDISNETDPLSPDTPVSNTQEPAPSETPAPSTEVTVPPSEGSAVPEPTKTVDEKTPYDPMPSVPPVHYSSSSNLVPVQ